MRGVPTSFSLCKLLKTVASSPEIAFCLADFFQSLFLYKKFVSSGHQKIATADAIAAKLKTFITSKVNNVILITGCARVINQLFHFKKSVVGSGAGSQNYVY